MTDPMDVIRAEQRQGIIDLESVRAFIHPVIPLPAVMPIIYRSRDDIAAAEAIQAERREPWPSTADAPRS